MKLYWWLVFQTQTDNIWISKQKKNGFIVSRQCSYKKNVFVIGHRVCDRFWRCWYGYHYMYCDFHKKKNKPSTVAGLDFKSPWFKERNMHTYVVLGLSNEHFIVRVLCPVFLSNVTLFISITSPCLVSFYRKICSLRFGDFPPSWCTSITGLDGTVQLIRFTIKTSDVWL